MRRRKGEAGPAKTAWVGAKGLRPGQEQTQARLGRREGAKAREAGSGAWVGAKRVDRPKLVCGRRGKASQGQARARAKASSGQGQLRSGPGSGSGAGPGPDPKTGTGPGPEHFLPKPCLPNKTGVGTHPEKPPQLVPVWRVSQPVGRRAKRRGKASKAGGEKGKGGPGQGQPQPEAVQGRSSFCHSPACPNKMTPGPHSPADGGEGPRGLQGPTQGVSNAGRNIVRRLWGLGEKVQ